jgi:hypothetical protein
MLLVLQYVIVSFRRLRSEFGEIWTAHSRSSNCDDGVHIFVAVGGVISVMHPVIHIPAMTKCEFSLLRRRSSISNSLVSFGRTRTSSYGSSAAEITYSLDRYIGYKIHCPSQDDAKLFPFIDVLRTPPSRSSINCSITQAAWLLVPALSTWMAFNFVYEYPNARSFSTHRNGGIIVFPRTMQTTSSLILNRVRRRSCSRFFKFFAFGFTSLHHTQHL